uniref:F-box domain-containing protein n=1 Tax=Aegilops tauschii TaxID=37682 RepID=M8BBI1_AEGTA
MAMDRYFSTDLLVDILLRLPRRSRRRARLICRHWGTSSMNLVGTCNGLLCLCDNKKSIGGNITRFNPATDETLQVLPLRSAEQFVGHHNLERWGDFA